MSTAALKMTALLFMLIDHIGEFLLPSFNLLRMIGRLSAPIFAYCVALGFSYTHNKKIYMSRMYLFGVFMAIGNYYIQNKMNIMYRNNIFITYFISTLVIYLMETLKSNRKKGVALISLFIGWQIVSILIIRNFNFNGSFLMAQRKANLFCDIFINIFACEGGIIIVLLPVVLYFAKENNKKLAITYITYSVVYSTLYATNIAARVINIVENDTIRKYLFYFFNILNVKTQVSAGRFYHITSYYWMIIFSLPFIIAYNGKKGKYNKLSFYLFYPAHIYFLCILQYL